MGILLRYNLFADTAEFILNALDLTLGGFAWLPIQFQGSGPSQPAARAIHDHGRHLQIP